MGFWTKLFGRSKDRGARCGKCGKPLQRDVPAMGAPSFDPFADAVRQVAGVLATPGYVCQKCGAVVCKGCLPLGGGSYSCPRCGSDESRHWSDGGTESAPTTKVTVRATGLVDNGDGTVTDHAAGLIWQKDDDGVTRTQQEASAYCGSLSLGGFSDWRLPQLSEFQSLKKAVASSGMALKATYSPNGDVYWTATDPPPGFPSNVAYAADGTTFYRTNKYYVRAVRRPS